MVAEELKKLNAVLRLYHANFLNLHWNTVGEEFNDAHKSISTDYYELCDKYIDVTAEMVTRFDENPFNYFEVCDYLKSCDESFMVIDSKKLYTRKDIIERSNTMLHDVVLLITAILDMDEIKDNTNAGIRSDLEAMHGEFDLQYRYINKRRMM